MRWAGFLASDQLVFLAQPGSAIETIDQSSEGLIYNPMMDSATRAHSFFFLMFALINKKQTVQEMSFDKLKTWEQENKRKSRTQNQPTKALLRKRPALSIDSLFYLWSKDENSGCPLPKRYIAVRFEKIVKKNCRKSRILENERKCFFFFCKSN